ncbi:hypothetical protein [Corynebacterium ulcerans]|uniref:hypothetical protein n=1 Tax=Corynebacterium ulcerans TaxID=65058 RepID=UPI00192B1CEE|nr:hypothetical protein [Corynebacterium ulcerans]MBL4943945.1 hypothetical protein [Corynebacterium ulcerans]
MARDSRVYLSVIIDCCGGKVVAAKMGVHPTVELVEATLRVRGFRAGEQRNVLRQDVEHYCRT